MYQLRSITRIVGYSKLEVTVKKLFLPSTTFARRPNTKSRKTSQVCLAKEDIPLFVDEFTEAGLFRQLKATPGHKAITGEEEASQFFERLLGGSREKIKIDLERLIQLYDGCTWVYTRGDKTARQVIDNPGVSLSGYNQPNRFFPIYVKLKERRDGGVDRIAYQPLPHRLAARETREFITKLNDSPVKDLR